jgi:diguanylate cyclase (GGDEF)-like protein/PAS domain S-box-containing protein
MQPVLGAARPLKQFITGSSLASRFTYAAAALAIVALLAIAIASWWLVRQQQAASLQVLRQEEAQLNAAIAGSTLHAIGSRLHEVAESTILASALADSAGKEAYLDPYLHGIRRINGIPIQILFADFNGKEIASNGYGSFSQTELAWLKARMDEGKETAAIFPGTEGYDLIAVELLTYSRTASPEGALLYKFSLKDIQQSLTAQLVWGNDVPSAGTGTHPITATASVKTTANFAPFQFRTVSGGNSDFFNGLAPQYLIIFAIAGALASAVFVLGSRLAQTLTRDLRRLEAFSTGVVNGGFDAKRADVNGTIEVMNLARSINHMLDYLHEQHSRLQQESHERGLLLSRYRLLIEGTNAISWELSQPGSNYDFVSPQAEQMFGHPIDIWNGPEFWKEYMHPDDLAQALHTRTEAVKNSSSYRCEYRLRHVNGSYRWLEEIGAAVEGDASGKTLLRGILVDISQRKASDEEIMHLAFYDFLTGLPNRRLLQDRLEQALAASARIQCQGALMFIDLDNFKVINDTLGHDKGDLLLQQVAQRLKSCVRDSDTVARLGGDEFVVMLENLNGSAEDVAANAASVGEKVIATLIRPYLLAGVEHHSTPSIGVALFKGHDNSAGDVLKRADLAMYQAKAAGRNTLRFFDPEIQKAVASRVALEADLRLGLQRNEFFLHYQPQLNDNDHVVGAEALVRWQHSMRGFVSPAEFIPLAEDSGLILPLGRWVLKTACAQLAVWGERPETALLNMSVNVSAREFRHPDFIAQVQEILDQTGADPRRLKLELTESVLVEDLEATIVKMNALKAKGVGLSLDDFGTGYSSLSYLRRLPLDQLKIDQSFIRDLLTTPNVAAIVQTIVSLGHSLGMEVIAEGVETDPQRTMLVRHGCHVYQGYLFSRPVPAEQFEAFMHQKNLA